MKFCLLGEETKAEIEVLCRSHPNCTDYWDGNWVLSLKERYKKMKKKHLMNGWG
jgi:hypothetical protein